MKSAIFSILLVMTGLNLWAQQPDREHQADDHATVEYGPSRETLAFQAFEIKMAQEVAKIRRDSTSRISFWKSVHKDFTERGFFDENLIPLIEEEAEAVSDRKLQAQKVKINAQQAKIDANDVKQTKAEEKETANEEKIAANQAYIDNCLGSDPADNCDELKQAKEDACEARDQKCAEHEQACTNFTTACTNLKAACTLLEMICEEEDKVDEVIIAAKNGAMTRHLLADVIHSLEASRLDAINFCRNIMEQY